MRGQNYLSNVNNSLNTIYQRLSSGLRINSAKDDAAGLQIADRLTSQINGLNQANRNANDAIALAQTMEGGLDEITNMLQHIRTLAVQASNGINTSAERTAIQGEVDNLVAEIDRIGKQTTYGGKTILAGDADNAIFSNAKTTGTDIKPGDAGAKEAGKISFQVGANKGDSIEISVNIFTFSHFALRAYNAGKPTDQQKTKFDDGDVVDGFKKAGTGGINGVAKLLFSFDMEGKATSVIDHVDKMLADVDSQRSKLGAIQNRLESLIRVQSNVATNTSDAHARIRDTDFAEESANLSQQSIIQQAATSMLMQANARPQLGLSLLG